MVVWEQYQWFLGTGMVALGAIPAILSHKDEISDTLKVMATLSDGCEEEEGDDYSIFLLSKVEG